MRVIICDESSQDIEKIRLYASGMMEYSIQYEFYDSSEVLLKDCEKWDKGADLFILSVEMAGVDGITVAREIRKKDMRALIVFLAGHAGYMADVFEVVTFDYIQKPITEERFRCLLVKAMAYLDMDNQSFSFDYRRRHYSIKSDEIIYFEKQGRQLVIYTRQEKYLTYMNLKELWTKVSGRSFVAIHGSFIVNLKYVKTILGDTVLLEDGTQLHVSRGCRKSLIEKHLKYVKNWQ